MVCLGAIRPEGGGLAIRVTTVAEASIGQESGGGRSLCRFRARALG